MTRKLDNRMNNSRRKRMRRIEENEAKEKKKQEVEKMRYWNEKDIIFRNNKIGLKVNHNGKNYKIYQ